MGRSVGRSANRRYPWKSDRLGHPGQTRVNALLRSAAAREYIEKAGVPDVTGVWSHPVTGRFMLAVSIKQRYPGHARQAAHVAAMCHAGAYMGRSVIVVADA